MSSTIDLVADLLEAFPHATVEPGTVRIYAEDLADLPPDLLEEGIRHLRRTTKFFPALSEIRRVVAEKALSMPGEDEALAQIKARIAWGGSQDGPPPFVHEDVRTALDRVGGYYAVKTATEPNIVRSQLLKAYREIRESRVEEIQVGGIPALQIRAA